MPARFVWSSDRISQSTCIERLLIEKSGATHWKPSTIGMENWAYRSKKTLNISVKMGWANWVNLDGHCSPSARDCIDDWTSSSLVISLNRWCWLHWISVGNRHAILEHRHVPTIAFFDLDQSLDRRLPKIRYSRRNTIDLSIGRWSTGRVDNFCRSNRRYRWMKIVHWRSNCCSRRSIPCTSVFRELRSQYRLQNDELCALDFSTSYNWELIDLWSTAIFAIIRRPNIRNVANAIDGKAYWKNNRWARKSPYDFDWRNRVGRDWKERCHCRTKVICPLSQLEYRNRWLSVRSFEDHSWFCG